MGLFNRLFGSPADQPDTRDFSDVTGEWEGYYTQNDDRSPIKARLAQDGNRISGTMTDGRTESDRSLFDATVDAGLPPGADEKIDERIRQMIPDAASKPIRVKSTLPDRSQLNGVIDGGFVRFTKTYQGQHIVGYQVGDQAITHAIEGHTVQYSGRLSGDGNMIEGIWTIHQSQTRKGYIDGSFLLRRL